MTATRSKYAKFMRARGVPLTVPSDSAVRRVRLLHDQYLMTLESIAEAASTLDHRISYGTVWHLYTGRGKRADGTLRARTATVRAVMAVPVPAEPVPPAEGELGASVPTCTALRRLEALALQGFPTRWVARNYTNYKDASLFLIFANRNIKAATYLMYKAAYDELNGENPDDYGIPKNNQGQAKAAARRRDAVPAHCWDDDTIDDPDAIPEWTGACGTVEGYWIHKREGHRFLIKHDSGSVREVIGCDACRRARSERVSSS